MGRQLPAAAAAASTAVSCIPRFWLRGLAPHSANWAPLCCRGIHVCNLCARRGGVSNPPRSRLCAGIQVESRGAPTECRAPRVSSRGVGTSRVKCKAVWQPRAVLKTGDQNCKMAHCERMFQGWEWRGSKAPSDGCIGIAGKRRMRGRASCVRPCASFAPARRSATAAAAAGARPTEPLTPACSKDSWRCRRGLSRTRWPAPRGCRAPRPAARRARTAGAGQRAAGRGRRGGSSCTHACTHVASGAMRVRMQGRASGAGGGGHGPAGSRSHICNRGRRRGSPRSRPAPACRWARSGGCRGGRTGPGRRTRWRSRPRTARPAAGVRRGREAGQARSACSALEKWRFIAGGPPPHMRSSAGCKPTAAGGGPACMGAWGGPQGPRLTSILGLL